MNKRQVGKGYESMAASYAEQLGYKIIEYNYQCRRGEIDLIARDGSYLVFIEVKYRKNDALGDPAEAVDFRKQQHIRRTAIYYLYEKGYGDIMPCRFDVIAITGREIRVIKDAF